MKKRYKLKNKQYYQKFTILLPFSIDIILALPYIFSFDLYLYPNPNSDDGLSIIFFDSGFTSTLEICIFSRIFWCVSVSICVPNLYNN